MHYFKYEHKIEMIPYIEQQVLQYLSHLRKELPHLNPQQKTKIQKLLLKKQKQIQDFFMKVYEDYRAPLILRTRQALFQFMLENLELFRDGREKMGKVQGKMEGTEKVEQIERIRKIQKEDKLMKTESEEKIEPRKVSLAAIKMLSKSIERQKEAQRSIHEEKQKQKMKQKKQQSPRISLKINSQRSLQKTLQPKKPLPKSPQTSLKPQPKPPQRRPTVEPVRKLTKQQYIQYLKNKQK